MKSRLYPVLAASLSLAGLLVACGEDGASIPVDAAAIDGAIDAPPIDGSGCGADTFFTGELVDWDSTEASFLGVFQATYTSTATTTSTDQTSPNGRAELCVPTAAAAIVQVDAPGTYLDGSVRVRSDVVAAGGFYSGRTLTAERKTTFFREFLLADDPTTGYLLVHVTGRQGTIAIDTLSAPPVAFDGTTWAVGDAETDVFFANIAGSSTIVSMSGTAVGATTVAIEPGKITYVTIVGQ